MHVDIHSWQRERIWERFWSKVEIRAHDECWPWMGGTQGGGYGQFSMGAEQTTAHRVAYILCIGPVPLRHVVMHTCDNPPCCNPAHLEHGRNADNCMDAVDKGRSVHMGALSARQVRDIRARSKFGMNQSALAREYRVAQSTISRITTGNTHRT